MIRDAVAEIFEPKTRWVIVRAFPKDGAGFEPVKVFDLYPVSSHTSERCFSIAHNGKRFAPSRDLVAFYNEAGRSTFDDIALRLLSAEALANLAYADLCKSDAQRELEC